MFTSYKAMQQMYSVLKDALPYPILLHGTTSRKALLEEFRRTPNAVLFGTSSFWQGVGAELSRVIIDRLPFAAPNDPLVVSRTRTIEAAGGSGFFDYQIPRAVIALNQDSAVSSGLLPTAAFSQFSIQESAIRDTDRYFSIACPLTRTTSDLAAVREFLWPAARTA